MKSKEEDHEKFLTNVPSDPNVVRSYEDKYPRLSGFTDDERKSSEQKSGSMEFDEMLKDRRIFDDFTKSDKHGFRKTMSDNLKSFNTSAHSLQNRTTLALLNFESPQQKSAVLGKRTFVKNRYFLIMINSCLLVIW